MVQSKASTVAQYLAELPAERRAIIERVREVILEHLPEGYEEAMNYGVISYQIPLERYPKTYNKQPLAYAALAAQKNYNALYLMAAYASSGAEQRLKAAYKKAGKKLDMGKSCLRFKKLEDLELEAIGEAIASTTVEEYIEGYEMSRK